MSVILYLAGLLIGAALFFYFLSLYNEGKKKVRQISGKGSTLKPLLGKRESTLEANRVSYPHLKEVPPGERMCPLCRNSLSKYEPLYASQVDTESGSRILIYGCGHCYKESGSSG
jgi:hypothetical protein